jgi:hypothetical protein
MQGKRLSLEPAKRRTQGKRLSPESARRRM